ncbi:MAG: hypothetical protein P4L31_01070 [Candidatus Babeliales bacterium]|nr:hypothetical protein [Candidatus Babeliales bacterium]
MKLKKHITMTIHIQPRTSGPLSPDERKQLASFFAAVIDMRPKPDERKTEKSCI